MTIANIIHKKILIIRHVFRRKSVEEGWCNNLLGHLEP
jgi:hypothetical protein